MRVLVIEDELPLGEGLVYSLSQKDHMITWQKDAETALLKIAQEGFDVIILDLGLPRMHGFEVLSYIRKSSLNQMTPILILTASNEVADRIKCLDEGADDYLIKPYDLNEVDARIRALYRRNQGLISNTLTQGKLTLDMASQRVTLDGSPVDLSRREFMILHKLMESKGRTIFREALVHILYGWTEEVDSNVIEVHIHNLRKKLGNSLIKTVRGIGYVIEKTENKAGEKNGSRNNNQTNLDKL